MCPQRQNVFSLQRVTNSWDATSRSFIYIFPTDLWDNTWHLVLSIHPSIHRLHPRHQKISVYRWFVCVLCWFERTKWLSNYIRVWDKSVGFSLQTWLFFLFFDCQGWQEASVCMHTPTQVHFTYRAFFSAPYLLFPACVSVFSPDSVLYTNKRTKPINAHLHPNFFSSRLY